MPEKQAQLGFSLKGLIVVLLICLFLLCLLLPAVLIAREKARRANCMNNLKQIGLNLHNYLDARRYFPGSAEMVGKKENRKPGGWSFLFKATPNFDYGGISPEFEISPVLIKNTTAINENQIVDPLTSTDSGIQHNRNQPLWVDCICPSNPNKNYEDTANKQVLFTNYKAMGATSMESLLLCVDPNSPPPYGSASQHPDGALFPTNNGIRIQDISDGTSHTIMVVETIDDTKSCWLAGVDATLVGMPNAKDYKSTDGVWFPLDYNGGIYEKSTPSIKSMRTYLAFDFQPGGKDANSYPSGVGRTPAYGPSSGHPNIVNHLFCDGSVRNTRKDVDYALYFFWITRCNNDTYENHPEEE